MNYFEWLSELDALATRFAHLGLAGDLGALTLAEAYALLTMLRRIADE